MNRLFRFAVAAAIIAAAAGRVPPATACPFCSAVSLTFSQEIAQSQAAVIARLVEPPPAGALSPRSEGPLPKGRFVVVKVLKGADLVAEAGLLGEDARPIEAITLEEKPAGTLFLLMGIEPPKLVWSSPIPVGDRAVAYLEKLSGLPEKGADRLAFFQHYLEDTDETLARDAYDEFAVAPYEDVRGLENRMDPTQLLAWIENPRVQASRRRLYATMLGVCGTKADAARIEAILVGRDSGAAADGGQAGGDRAELRSGLDALIACYVTLRGAEGLDLVDRLFLRRQGRDVPFTETYAAVMALRFLGEESETVPRTRVLESLRILLEEPKLADLVIADLARWEDWSAVATLTDLFEKADADNIFVREPIVNYLRACPLPEAAEALKKLEAIDPEAVRRAAALAGFAGAIPPRPATSVSGTDRSTSVATVDDADPGESPPGPPPAADARSGGDAALAARIAPVLGDEEANDDRAGVDPSAAPPAPVSSSPVGSPSSARWAVWLAAVLLVGWLARAALQSVANGDSGGRGR